MLSWDNQRCSKYIH